MSHNPSTNSSNRKRPVVPNSGRTRFSHPTPHHSDSNSIAIQNLVKLNQLVDTLKSLKRLISHYFDQISKQSESNLAGDVRRVYRRILLLYVKYRRRQNYEKRRMKQTIDDESDPDDHHSHPMETTNSPISPTWTMKKIVSSQSLPFTRAGFDADHDGIEDFDEIALTATRDVANIQNHCIRLILNDHQMKLPVYALPTRWDSEIPKQMNPNPSKLSSVHSQVPVEKKFGMKSSNLSPTPSSISSDQELFLGSLARQLNDQTWHQLHSILANLNSQTSPLIPN